MKFAATELCAKCCAGHMCTELGSLVMLPSFSSDGASTRLPVLDICAMCAVLFRFHGMCYCALVIDGGHACDFGCHCRPAGDV